MNVEASYAVVKQMLVDRGKDVSSFDTDPHLATASVVAQSKGGANQVFFLDVASCNLRIVYNLMSKFKAADIKAPMVFKSDADINHAIIISRENTTTGTLLPPAAQIKTYEVFRLASLCINIVRHSLQPKFEVMSNEDVAAVLKYYGGMGATGKNKLPVIYSSDPIARYFDMKAGQVVRITRTAPSGGTSVYYRCCHMHKVSSTTTSVIREQDA